MATKDISSFDDAVDEAIENMRQYGVIEHEHGNYLYLNLRQLMRLGYILLIVDDNLSVPTFCKISSLKHQSAVNFYTLNVIPKESLQSYVIIQLKDDWSSLKATR